MTATPWDVEPKPQPTARKIAPHEACERCKGTGGIPIGPGLFPSELEYDECPDCIGDGLNTEARRVRREIAHEIYKEWWA